MIGLSNLPEYLRQQAFIAFDTETTGMWAPVNRIVELAAVKFTVAGGESHVFQSLVNPDRAIPEEVIRIHGITDEMVKDAPSAKTVLGEFIAFCGGDSVLVAHNAPFDISFLGSELNRAGIEFGPNPILDTVDIYHRYYPGLASYSLMNLSRHFNIAPTQEHRALSDARLVESLVLKATEKMGHMKTWPDMETSLLVHRMSSWRAETVLLTDEYADIQTAIAEHLRLEIDYNHPVKSSSSRIIHPQQIFKLGQLFYINAYCELAGGERTFRLDRILKFKLLRD